AEEREVDVLRPPRVRVVLPRIRAGLDRDEAISSLRVGQAAAGAGEVGVERRRMPVDLVRVPARRVRLPDLDERVRDRPAGVVEDAPGDDDPLAERLSVVMAGEVAVELVD